MGKRWAGFVLCGVFIFVAVGAVAVKQTQSVSGDDSMGGSGVQFSSSFSTIQMQALALRGTSILQSPTLTPTQTPLIQTGTMPYANATELHAAIQSLKAEKRVSLYVDGAERSFERWDLVYEAPDQRLLQVYDYSGKLERTEYDDGMTTTIDGGKINQEFSNREPQAWEKTVHFLLDIDSKTAQDSRELLPGVWIPNSSQTNWGLLKSPHVRSIRRTFTEAEVNTDVGAELPAKGH